MPCGSGGCGSGGCGRQAGLRGAAPAGGGLTGLPTLGGPTGGCGGGCSSGSCGTEPWDGTYRDVVGVKLAHHAKTFYFDSTGFLLLGGDHCIVESDQGEAYGTVAQATGPSRKFAGVRGMKKVLRRARPEDEQVQERNAALGREALDDCRSRARALNLDMKLVSVDAAFDERKLTFFFTAEERVDFRELVRDLAQRFRRRIEMRQVGARDEAKILGGYGICGRPLCCSTFLTEFAPISVRMAKRQGLSLNPSKISGLCGRLMCCLRYEDYDVGGRPAAAKGDPVEAPPQPAPSSPPAASSSS